MIDRQVSGRLSVCPGLWGTGLVSFSVHHGLPACLSCVAVYEGQTNGTRKVNPCSECILGTLICPIILVLQIKPEILKAQLDVRIQIFSLEQYVRIGSFVGMPPPLGM